MDTEPVSEAVRPSAQDRIFLRQANTVRAFFVDVEFCRHARFP